MPRLDDLIEASRAQIREALEQSTAPVLLCSFGKDSMVLLHLLRSMGLDLPVVFHRDPWFPHKYAFADRMIREWNLTVWDWQPVAVSLWHGKGIVAFTNHYQIGQKPTGEPVTCSVPKNILPPVEGKPYLCGLADLMHRPTGTFQYPWDMAFIGHKSSDQDQIAGRVPLHTDLVRVDHGPTGAFPLRHWTDDDIWDYTDRFAVPVQTDRYYRDDLGWDELPDKTANSDYWTACMACIDRRNGPVVDCPKLKRQVRNVSGTVAHIELRAAYFGEEAPTCSSNFGEAPCS